LQKFQTAIYFWKIVEKIYKKSPICSKKGFMGEPSQSPIFGVHWKMDKVISIETKSPLLTPTKTSPLKPSAHQDRKVNSMSSLVRKKGR
jgi:hypothetical protein